MSEFAPFDGSNTDIQEGFVEREATPRELM